MAPRVAISCDHGGFELKDKLVSYLEDKSVALLDLGVHAAESVDYPDKAHAVAEAVLSNRADFGIIICGTGIGVSMAANRHRGIRAALCTDPYMARMSRAHNDANVLCLGGRVVGPSLAEDIVDAFLAGAFDGGRHARRVEKIEIQ
jgi:ribose 5-phosphate isomerase B